MPEISFCDRCDASIPRGELQGGAAGETEGLLLCARCRTVRRRRRLGVLVVFPATLLLAAGAGAAIAVYLLAPRIETAESEIAVLGLELDAARDGVTRTAVEIREVRGSQVRLAEALETLEKATLESAEQVAILQLRLFSELAVAAGEIRAVKDYLGSLHAVPGGEPPAGGAGRASLEGDAETWLALARNADARIRHSALIALEAYADPRIPDVVAEGLGDPESVVRAQAALMAGTRRLEQCLPALTDLLEDENDHVRDVADRALEAIAGVDFGFDAAGTEAERKKSVERIRKWLAERGG